MPKFSEYLAQSGQRPPEGMHSATGPKPMPNGPSTSSAYNPGMIDAMRRGGPGPSIPAPGGQPMPDPDYQRRIGQMPGGMERRIDAGKGLPGGTPFQGGGFSPPGQMGGGMMPNLGGMAPPMGGFPPQSGWNNDIFMTLLRMLGLA